MRLKAKLLKLSAGRPIAFLNEKTAKDLNVHSGDRIEITYKNRKMAVVIDLVKELLKPDEISASEEVVHELGFNSGEMLDISLAPGPKSARYILKKMNGGILNKEQIESIIRDIVNNELTDAEIAYFVSGVYNKGMSMKETIYLTQAMYKTGSHIEWRSSQIADKHSIGGVPGNRTTPIVVSICAAAGIIMPKTSSRAITTAAGTADVIESIARVDFPVSKLKKIVNKVGACLAWGGSLGLAPADDRLIQIERTLNLDPEPQLLASIMAKKLSVGSRYILIDIPYGKGAKVSKREGEKLREKFLKIGEYFGLKMKVVLTDGSQPIGNGIGPIQEIKDILKVLKRDNPPKDLEAKAVFLSSCILEMMKKAERGEGKKKALEILDSGEAFKKFKEIIKEQNGKLDGLKESKFKHSFYAAKNGKIREINNKKINALGRVLGSPADKAAGMYLNKHVHEKVKKNEEILIIYAESKERLRRGIEFFKKQKPIVVR